MYALSGGVAKYVELFIQAKALSFEAMINEIFSENSLFLDELINLGKIMVTIFQFLL
ncbi:MAG: hypothetical protein LBS29_04090 [Endomicrobium sp.]|jgi:hypothetical protein|nr:hypothetical protein [Endomicrobium sp.]